MRKTISTLAEVWLRLETETQGYVVFAILAIIGAALCDGFSYETFMARPIF